MVSGSTVRSRTDLASIDSLADDPPSTGPHPDDQWQVGPRPDDRTGPTRTCTHPFPPPDPAKTSRCHGCELAWIVLLCVVEENGQPRMMAPGVPELRFAFLRRSDCKILDTWRVGGLRGTDSHDVVVESVGVPRRRSMFVAESTR